MYLSASRLSLWTSRRSLWAFSPSHARAAFEPKFEVWTVFPLRGTAAQACFSGGAALGFSSVFFGGGFLAGGAGFDASLAFRSGLGLAAGLRVRRGDRDGEPSEASRTAVTERSHRLKRLVSTRRDPCRVCTVRQCVRLQGAAIPTRQSVGLAAQYMGYPRVYALQRRLP